jgi:ZIP family zinc transporter
VAGLLFLLGAQAVLGAAGTHHRRLGTAAGTHHRRLGTAGRRRAALVFLVLFVHSLPEGLAMGSAWAAEPSGLGVFVLVTIAVQNVPEGTVTAIPLAEAGVGPARQFVAAVATSLPQPVGAVIAFLLVEQVTGLLPLSFAFAAGAMLALVVVDLAPDAWRSGERLRAPCSAAP